MHERIVIQASRFRHSTPATLPLAVSNRPFLRELATNPICRGAMTKRLIPLLLVVAFVSCDDEAAKPGAVPTAPAVAPSAAAASATAADISGGSTICRVYATERDVAKTELDAAPTDTLAQRRVKTLDALVKETCD